jgi:exosortase
MAGDYHWAEARAIPAQPHFAAIYQKQNEIESSADGLALARSLLIQRKDTLILEATNDRLSREDWVKLGVVTAAVVALYAPVMVKLARDWWHDPNYSFGFLIPPLAACLIWVNRKRLMETPIRPSNWGLLLAFGSAALLFLGSLGAELFLARISLVGMLAALVVFLFGWRWLWRLAFPMSVLLLMIPPPEIIFNELTFPMQLAATRLAGGFLDAVRIPVLLEGNLIELPNNMTLEVAVACSGVRSVMALFAAGVTYAYFLDNRQAVRWILVAATIPIAVIANGVRIAGTGVLSYLVSEKAADGYFHLFSGWVIFVSGFLLIVALHKTISLCWRGFHRLAPQ